MARTRGDAAPSDLDQIKVTLRNVLPTVWRQILVPSDISLAKLHSILQAAMGWTDTHL